MALKEFDFIPSKRFNSTTMKENSISDIEMERIGKICCKYGVSFFMNNTFSVRQRTNSNSDWMRIVFFAEEDNYYTYDGFRDFSNDYATDRYDTLMDCMHELDSRTCLWFNSLDNCNIYDEAMKFGYEDIVDAMYGPVLVKKLNCNFDEEHEYYTTVCRYVKLKEVRKEGTCNLVDIISGIYKNCIKHIMENKLDTGCRMGKASARQLGRYMPLEGLVTCCKLDFKCGKHPEAKDFCMYLLQYSDGSIYYLLIDSDGKSHRKKHSDYLDQALYMLTMYLLGELGMNESGHYYNDIITTH